MPDQTSRMLQDLGYTISNNIYRYPFSWNSMSLHFQQFPASFEIQSQNYFILLSSPTGQWRLQCARKEGAMSCPVGIHITWGRVVSTWPLKELSDNYTRSHWDNFGIGSFFTWISPVSGTRNDSAQNELLAAWLSFLCMCYWLVPVKCLSLGLVLSDSMTGRVGSTNSLRYRCKCSTYLVAAMLTVQCLPSQLGRSSVTVRHVSMEDG